MKSSDELIMEIHGSCIRTEEKLAAHIENLNIHQNPPCRFHRQLSTRLWGLLVVGLMGIGGNIYLWFKD